MQTNDKDFDIMKNNPNDYILEIYNEISLLKDLLKDVRLEKKEKLNDNDEFLEVMNQYEEKMEELKPIKEKLKVQKEAFKVANLDLFEKDTKYKNKILKLNNKIVNAWAYKKEINDETPIIIDSWKTKKQLTIKMDPKMKKEKID